jgi:hypothetical protein
LEIPHSIQREDNLQTKGQAGNTALYSERGQPPNKRTGWKYHTLFRERTTSKQKDRLEIPHSIQRGQPPNIRTGWKYRTPFRERTTSEQAGLEALKITSDRGQPPNKGQARNTVLRSTREDNLPTKDRLEILYSIQNNLQERTTSQQRTG